jgi:hypothetical protein
MMRSKGKFGLLGAVVAAVAIMGGGGVLGKAFAQTPEEPSISYEVIAFSPALKVGVTSTATVTFIVEDGDYEDVELTSPASWLDFVTLVPTSGIAKTVDDNVVTITYTPTAAASAANIVTLALDGAYTLVGTYEDEEEDISGTLTGTGLPINSAVGAATSLVGGTITITGTYTYTGSRIVVPASGVAVKDNADETVNASDYTYTVTGVNAGTNAGTLTVTGKNSYAGQSIEKAFDIARKTLDSTEFYFSPPLASFPAAGDPLNIAQGVSVLPKTFSGMGKITTVYKADTATVDTWTEAPSTWIVNSYIVGIKFDGGTNFTAQTTTPLIMGDSTVAANKYKVGPASTTALSPSVLVLDSSRATTRTYGEVWKLTRPTISNTSVNGSLSWLTWAVYDAKTGLKLADTTQWDNTASPPAAIPKSLDGSTSQTSAWLSGEQTFYPITGLAMGVGTYTLMATCSTTVTTTDPVTGVSSSVGKTGRAYATVTVTPRDLEVAKVALLGGPFAYKGEEQTYTLDVKDSLWGTGGTIVPTSQYIDDTRPSMITAAGTGRVVLTGRGNYVGVNAPEFQIALAPVSVNVYGSTVDSRPYDGTDAAEAKLFNLAFTGLKGGEEFVLGRDYTITAGKFATVSVGDLKTVTATVGLNPYGSVAKNYDFVGETNIALSMKGEITRLPQADIAANPSKYFTIPKPADADHYFKDTPQGLGSVDFKAPFDNGPGGTVELVYTYTTTNPVKKTLGDNSPITYPKDSSMAPSGKSDAASTYAVKLVLNSGANIQTLKSIDTILIGTYTIKAPAKPAVNTGASSPLSGTAKQGIGGTVKVVATSPNGGNLLYQWYVRPAVGADRLPTSEEVAGSTTADSLRTKNPVQGPARYVVVVTNSNPNVQVDDSTTYGPIVITVGAPPPTLTGARVEFADTNKTYTYTGDSLTPGRQTPAEVKVWGKRGTGADTTWFQLAATAYVLSYANNVNVGTATIRAEIKDTSYIVLTGSPSATFEIGKKDIATADLEFVPRRGWSPAAVGAEVKLATGKSGATVSKVYYNGSEEIPTALGTYTLTADVENGDNFVGKDGLYVGTYTIEKKTLTRADLYVSSLVKPYTGSPIGIDTVYVLADRGTGYGELKVQYSETETGTYVDELPVLDKVFYAQVTIAAGGNFNAAVIPLGKFEIYDPTSVAEIERVVLPGSGAEVAVVAPVVKPAASFTAGPNPAKSGSAVKFFYTGKSVKSGAILVYASTGKLVKKVAVTGGVVEVASWTADVPAGAYIAKGVLKTESGKEKVSALILVK